MAAVILPLTKSSWEVYLCKFVEQKWKSKQFAKYLWEMWVRLVKMDFSEDVPGFLIPVDSYVKPAPRATLYPDNEF